MHVALKCGKVDIKTHPKKARESYFEQVDIEFRSKGTVLTKEKDGEMVSGRRERL